MSRETFLKRVRNAAQAGRMYRVHTREPADSDAGYVGVGADPADRLAAEIIAVGGQAHLVENAAEARQRLSELLAHYRPRTALCWQHPLLDRLPLQPLLDALQIEAVTHERLAASEQAEQRKVMFAADIGITSATYAVAETGTLVMASAPGRERLASLLPPVHVGIVDASQILPDLFDLFGKLQTDGVDALPSNLALITGPSKTGDIELKLTTGVHGPGEWHVIIVRQTITDE